MTLWQLLAEDFRTHDGSLTEAGFWALAVHRVGTWAQSKPAAVRHPLRALTGALSVGTEWLVGIRLAPDMKIGRRMRIWHHGCINIAAREIGDDVHIRHSTTMGPAGGSDSRPVIGDRVEVGVGACILGDVRVGNDAMVGANALIVQDVPDSTVMAGVPARRVVWADR
jgi:serine O-acetyltransferase